MLGTYKKYLSKFNIDFGWNVSSLVLVGLSGLLLNTLLLALKGDASLGVFNQVLSIYAIAAQVAVCGVQFSVLQQCSWQSEDLFACRGSLLSGLILVGIISSILASGLFFLAESFAFAFDSPAIGAGVKAVSWGIVFFCLNKVLLIFLNAMQHMRAFAVFQALRFVFINLFIVVGIKADFPDGYLPVALSCAEFVLCLTMSIYIRLQFFQLLKLRYFNSELIKLIFKHLKFGTRGFLSGFLIEMNTRTDILMLGLFISDEKVGIYSFAAAFAEGFAQLIIAMRRNIDPLLGRFLCQNDFSAIKVLSLKIRKHFYPFMAAVGLFLIAAFPIILQILNRSENLQEYLFVLCILIGGFVLISGYNCFIGVLIQGRRPGAFTIIMIITTLVNISLNYSLIPIWGIFGAASATSFAYIVQTILAIVSAKHLLKVSI